MKFYESPYNFPSKSDLFELKDIVQKSRNPLKRFVSRFAIGDKVRFKIGKNAEVDAYIYAVRFEGPTVWYDILFDPYVGTPDEGSYTILTNVRSLMIHPAHFAKRVKISNRLAEDIKMKIYKSILKESKTWNISGKSLRDILKSHLYHLKNN